MVDVFKEGREWNGRREALTPPPPPSFQSISIFGILCVSALELIDRESHASVCERTRLLANLEDGYPFHLIDT